MICKCLTHIVIAFVLTVRLLCNVICCRSPLCCRCVFVYVDVRFTCPLVWRKSLSWPRVACPPARPRLTLSHTTNIPPHFLIVPRGVARRCGGAGRTGRHLLGAANGQKLFLKIHAKVHIVISYVFACNKSKALQLQRVPILSILGYNIGSLAASGSTLLVLRQFCVGAGLYRILVRSFLK